MPCDRAVRNLARVVIGRAIAVYNQLTIRRLIAYARDGIIRVRNNRAINAELVNIDVWLHRPHLQRPNSIFTFLKRNRRSHFASRKCERPRGQQNFLRFGSLNVKGHSPIIVNFRRNHIRSERHKIFDIFMRIPIQIHLRLLGAD